mgnify:CR=1 FL=1
MAIKKEDKAIEVTMPTVEVETKVETKKAPVEKKVEVATNEDLKIYYGDRWYFFNKGEKVSVIPEIKEYLRLQGALAVL